MADTGQKPVIEFDQEDFDFKDMDEELAVDQRCQSILQQFYLDLQAEGMEPQTASDLAFAADLYVRDYLLDFARQNVMRPSPGIVRRFAATWFITHTLDPEMRILERHLEAISRFYRFLHRQHCISAEELAFLEDEAGRSEYYRGRIDSFLAIHGDGYIAWEAECPLRGEL